jgi:hypothetical protein
MISPNLERITNSFTRQFIPHLCNALCFGSISPEISTAVGVTTSELSFFRSQYLQYLLHRRFFSLHLLNPLQ